MNKKYDITIIGSGLSGLVCAYILGKEGYSVCILEKNKQVGGCLQTFVRDKCIFDVGVHYIGGLSAGQSLHQFFKYFGIMEQLQLKKMSEDAFDIITFEGDNIEYGFAQGETNFVDKMTAHFPKEKKAIERYMQLLKESCNKFPLYNLQIEAAYPSNFDHLAISAKKVIESLTTNPKLRAVLSGSGILYGGYANTPFYLYAMVIYAYIQSSWRCVNGGSQIARLLVKEIRKQGGDIFKNKKVDYFNFEGKKIKSIVLETGEEVQTKEVISSVHPAQLSQFVRHEKGKLRKAYTNRIQNLKPTASTFAAHYVLKTNKVEYLNSNYYHNKTLDTWGLIDYNHNNWPSHYLALTPATTKSKKYADSLAVMSYMKQEEVAQWNSSFNRIGKEGIRGQDYEDFKAEKAEKLLQEVYKKFPQLRGNILSTHSSSPLSFRDYIGTPTGSLYGFERDFSDPARSSISVQTRIPNLKLTGQNINVHGIFGVTISGIITCMHYVEKKKLLKDIVSA